MTDEQKVESLKQAASAMVDDGECMCAFIFAVWRKTAGGVTTGVGCAAEDRSMFRVLANSLRTYAEALERGEYQAEIVARAVLAKGGDA